MVLARFYTLCCCLSEPSIKTYRRVFTSAIGRNGVVENMLDLATCSKKLAIFIFPILFHPQTLWCMPTISVSALVGHTEDSKWVAPHPAQYPCRLPKWGQPPRHLCRQAFVNNLSRYSRGMPSNKHHSQNPARCLLFPSTFRRNARVPRSAGTGLPLALMRYTHGAGLHLDRRHQSIDELKSGSRAKEASMNG